MIHIGAVFTFFVEVNPHKKLNPTAIVSSGVSVHLFNPNLLNYENLIILCSKLEPYLPSILITVGDSSSCVGSMFTL
jgi:hypothetical protein